MQTTESPSSLGPLLYDFALLLVLFLLLNLDRRFREYAGRSLIRPFNFFADIRDGRLLPNGQTTVLAFVLAGGFAIAMATLMNGYAISPAGRKIFSSLLPSSALTNGTLGASYASLLIWGTLISFVLVIVLALLMRFAAIFVKGRIYFSDTYNIVVWSLLPLAFLLAYDLILPRMDFDHPTAVLSGVILLVIFLWSYLRVLKGAGVLFDIYPTRIYLYGVAFLALVAVVAFVFLQKWEILANFSPATPLVGRGA